MFPLNYEQQYLKVLFFQDNAFFDAMADGEP